MGTTGSSPQEVSRSDAASIRAGLANLAGVTSATRDPSVKAGGKCRVVKGGKGLKDFALLGAQCRFRRGLHAGNEFVLLLP